MGEEIITEVIGSITFFRKGEQVHSRFEFARKFFKDDKAIANKVMEGLHYDFLYRMKEEGLVHFQPTNSG